MRRGDIYLEKILSVFVKYSSCMKNTELDYIEAHLAMDTRRK